MTSDAIDPFTPAVDLAAAIRRKEVSPVEVADMYLDRIDDLDPGLNAFCHRADEDVRRAAAAAADVVARSSTPDDLPPFLGVPLPIKDTVDVAGWPTTHGSAATSRDPVATSDPVVQRFVDAGFVLLGKTTTSEFGSVFFTESDALGISRNPWDRARSPGGSSSGAGAAVAAGMAPIAHGSDGGGSIRVPASCTGLFGLKPTRGRVSNRTVDIEGLGTNGVVTRTVADTAVALDLLARHDPAAWWSAPNPPMSYASAADTPAPAGLRIGVLTDAPVAGIGLHPSCRDAVDRTLRTLEGAGHHVVDTALPLPPSDELLETVTLLWDVGGAGVALEDPDKVEPHNRALRDTARTVDSWAYAEGVKKAQLLSRRLVEAFVAGFDLLVTPTMACIPPLVGAWRTGTPEGPMQAVSGSYPMAVFTSCSTSPGNRRSRSPCTTTRPPASRSACSSSRRPGARTSCCRWPAPSSSPTRRPTAGRRPPVA